MALEKFASGFYKAVGALLEHGIRLWVCLTGRLVDKSDAAWLSSPIGTRGRIGNEFYAHLGEREGLTIGKSADAGLLPSFDLLKGPHFDPALVRVEIRDFYEHTARFHLEAWSETGLLSSIFLWGLVTFVSRRMDQLNFPLSPLELSAGMRSEVIELDDSRTGERVYTGWLRTMVATGKIIYAGLYSTTIPQEYAGPCVKVSFPVPQGSATVILRPEVTADGSFRLISQNTRFGGPGFYRIVALSSGKWRVRYIKTLHEIFHVYVDAEGILRTDHTIHFLGLTVLRLHYKITPGKS
ncbi:MAG TPA: hypothetical protein VN846_07680 [Candidatus Cybelea sp.]|nr:hypothetical protein [Candidatus Cybelea sp.]